MATLVGAESGHGDVSVGAPSGKTPPVEPIGGRVWLNGKVLPVASASVSLLDGGLQHGEALFETVRVYRSVAFRLDAHLDRLGDGARALGIPVPSSAMLRAAVPAYLAACGATEARLRIVLSAGSPGGSPTLALIATPADRPASAAVCVLAEPRSSLGRLGAVKLCARVEYRVARDRAIAAGADEALLTAPDGRILEGTRSNLFLVRDGGLVTPPTDGAILDGVTRGVVLEIARGMALSPAEEPVTRDAIRAAAEVFLTGSVQEVRPVREVRGLFAASDAPGPVTRRVQAAYATIVQRETTLR